METKANTALIGAFTLVVLALGFVFIYWLARGSETTATTPLTVIFEDPVTGLSVGSQVVFNGIKVGDVKSLNLDPDNPKVVIATLHVQPLRSIKTDTQVTLGFQGLTGVGYVEMAGGSPTLAPIWEAMPEPTITAARSSMQDLLAGARTILARTDETLQSVERLVSQNTDDISQAIRDVRGFTGALAENSDNVAEFLKQVAAASAGIAEATAKLQGIVGRSEALIAAVDPALVGSTLANIATATESLATQSQRFKTIAERTDSITADLQGFSQHLPALGQRADALLAAVDPGKVTKTLDDVNQFTTALAGASDDIDAIMGDARAVATRFKGLGDRADSLMTKLDSMAGQGTGGILEDAQATLAAIRGAADSFNAQVAVLGGGLGEFSDRGLRDFQNLVSEGQRTISRLDRVISDLEQNPSGLLFGGQPVPEYNNRRR